MILDIRYIDNVPKQFQHVRMFTIYPKSDGRAKPEIVVHFYDTMYPQMNVALEDIQSITVTND